MTRNGRSPVIDLLLSVVGALGAALGGLGFVAVVGALVMQARFRGAGLPSELSASLNGRGVDVAVGIEVILPAVIAALGLVGVVHWWPDADAGGRPGHLLWKLSKALGRRRWPAFGLVLAGLAIYYYLLWAGSEVGTPTQVRILLLVIAATLLSSAAATTFARHARRSRAAKDGVAEAAWLTGAAAVAAVLVCMIVIAADLSNPLVRPMAAVLSNPRELICGVYVGETAEVVYVGEAVPQLSNGDLGDHSRGTLVQIGRARIVRVVVGASKTLAAGLRDADAIGANFGMPGSIPALGCAPLGLTVRFVKPRDPGSSDPRERARGLLIEHVSDGGAGARTGLRTGDVIETVGGRAADREGVLRAVLASHRPGDQIPLQVTTQTGRQPFGPIVPNWPAGL